MQQTLSGLYVFLSYASVDRPAVLPVVQALKSEGIQVWIDQVNIAGGANYGQEIARAIRGCSALIVACSPGALQSRNIKQEIQLGWKYQRPYLPILLEPTTIPEDIEYWLEGWQWVDVSGRPENEWLPEVLRALRKILNSQSGARQPPADANPAHLTPPSPGPVPDVVPFTAEVERPSQRAGTRPSIPDPEPTLILPMPRARVRTPQIEQRQGRHLSRFIVLVVILSLLAAAVLALVLVNSLRGAT